MIAKIIREKEYSGSNFAGCKRRVAVERKNGSTLEITPPDNRQAVFDSLDDLVVAPIIEEYSMMADIITDKLSRAASGELTVEDALDQAQEECSAQITLQ